MKQTPSSTENSRKIFLDEFRKVKENYGRLPIYAKFIENLNELKDIKNADIRDENGKNVLMLLVEDRDFLPDQAESLI